MTPSDGMLAATARSAKLAEKARTQPRDPETKRFVSDARAERTVSLEDIPTMLNPQRRHPLAWWPWIGAWAVSLLVAFELGQLAEAVFRWRW